MVSHDPSTSAAVVSTTEPKTRRSRSHDPLYDMIQACRGRSCVAPDVNDVLMHILGTTLPIERIKFEILTVAPVSLPVLITGPSGSGKERVAEAIHLLSPRSIRPYRPLDCTAIPKDLVESILFGHTKGSFTGAGRDEKGVFEMTDGGTIFLDEIGELPKDQQTKLLRVLETQEFYRIGGQTPISVDVRLLAATNRDLEKLTREGRFLEELYYRLMAFPIEVPSLDERKGDISILTRHFLTAFNQREGKEVEMESRAGDVIATLRFPGNIRQLRNLVECAATLAAGFKSAITFDVITEAASKLKIQSETWSGADGQTS